MNSTTLGTPLALFGSTESATRARATPAAPEPVQTPQGLRPAAARLIHTTTPDMSDPQRRRLALLVVECPFCEHQHIHPGGHVSAPRVCLRRSRCVGRPAGAYYFPNPEVPR